MKAAHTVLFLLLISLVACSHAPATHSPITTVEKPDTSKVSNISKPTFIGLPAPTDFSICHGHTCAEYAYVSLDNTEWSQIQSLFSPVAKTAEQEREQIRQAVAQLERLVGLKAGTANDKGKNTTGLGLTGQMDCIDESTNTTVYLRMMQNDGLLQWHQQASRVSRGFFSGLFQMPHSTAVIRENNSEQAFAVDSWFLDNGQAPFIVPINDWQDGWTPDDME